jgi:hypothetical protein
MKWLVWLTLCFISSGCNALDNSVSVVDDGFACGRTKAPGMYLVKKGLSIDNTWVGVKQSDTLSHPKADGQDALAGSLLIRVDMGQQPSGGYGLKLLSDKLAVSGQTASFALQWVEPKPRMGQIQILTYPCLYLKIAKGNYTRLEVVDENGVVQHGLDLP